MLEIRVPLALLRHLGVRRVRPVAIVVQSQLSIDEARRAIIASTQDGPPAFDFGQSTIYGTVGDHTFDLRIDRGEDVPAGFLRGTLRADGSHVQVHALVTEEPTPIVLWLFVLAIPFIILLALLLALSRLPTLAFGDIGRALVVGALCGVTALLAFRRPTRPSGFLVTKAKAFLSRALLAEAIEVDAGVRYGQSS